MIRAGYFHTLILLIVSSSLFAQERIKISADQLPEAVSTELKEKYKKYDIGIIQKIENKEHGILYLVNVKKKKKELKLSYTEKGILIRTSRIYTYQDTSLPGKSPGNHDGHNHQH